MAIELPPEGQEQPVAVQREPFPAPAPGPLPAVQDGAGVVEGVIVSGAAAAPPAVAGTGEPVRLPGERNDILPPWMRSRAELRAAVVVVGGQQWHRARYHGLRSPGYLISALFWALAAVLRVAAIQLSWAWMTDAMALQSQAAADADSRVWRQLHRDVQETRRVRLSVLAFEALMIASGCVALVRLAPWWAQAAAAVAMLPLLAWIGRPEGRPIISQAIVPPQYEPPSRSLISEALGTLSIAEINKALREGGPGIRFLSDPFRDGPGWTTLLDLPKGVTVTAILAKREELASGLRRPLSATWPGGVPHEHPGRLDLWVGLQDISKMKPPAWPLIKARSVDVFEPVPFGTDPRQRPVTASLFETNWLVGAAPGQGKTSVVRGVACAVALDVRAELWIHEQAGKGDLEPLAQVCHRYCSGLDDEAIGYAADSLRRLRAELDTRSAQLKRIPRERRPEGKITPEMAAHRHLGLHPLVAFFDEVQNVFGHPEYGKQAADDAGYVIRLGRAYGVILFLSTQRPDKDSVPTSVTGNVSCRFCLHVPGQVENDLVLGTSSYKNGYNATLFRPRTNASPGDAGLGWLKADGQPQIVRTYKVDLPEAEKVANRARAMREHAGTLTGYALGEDVLTASPRDILADAAEVFGDAAGLQWPELAQRLAERWPDRWADLTAEAVSSQLRNRGVPSVDVKADGQVLKGCRKVAVERELYQ